MWHISKNIEWNSLYNEFDWIRDMRGVIQSPIHHAEGDVETHTKMVYSELLKLEEYKSLDTQSQNILIAAALLHDVEKRSTTVIEDDGHITSKNHARKGEYTSRDILYKMNTPFSIRETICKLVRYHGLPLWFSEKTDTLYATLKASVEVNTKLLYILAKADALGRICEDSKDLLYRLDLFQEYCKENDCWGKPKEFASNYARYIYFKESGFHGYEPYDNRDFKVVLMSAIAGTGKDTYIQNHYPTLPTISLDDIRIEMKAVRNKKWEGRVIQEAKKQAKEYLASHKSFIWNSTNLIEKNRKELIDLFATYNAIVEIVYLEVDVNTLLKQNSMRIDAVPESVVKKMIKRVEPPSLWEADNVIYNVS